MRRGETRRGITRLAANEVSESRGYRVSGASLYPEAAGCAVGLASIEDMLIRGGLGEGDDDTVHATLASYKRRRSAVPWFVPSGKDNGHKLHAGQAKVRCLQLSEAKCGSRI